MLILQRADARLLVGVVVMLDSMLVWVAVLFAAFAFGAFLFGISSALTLLDRFVRPRGVSVRVGRGVHASPRLWA
jgi:hypothetical protein